MEVVGKDPLEMRIFNILEIAEDVDFPFAFPVREEECRDSRLIDGVQRYLRKRGEEGRVCHGWRSGGIGDRSRGDPGANSKSGLGVGSDHSRGSSVASGCSFSEGSIPIRGDIHVFEWIGSEVKRTGRCGKGADAQDGTGSTNICVGDGQRQPCNGGGWGGQI